MATITINITPTKLQRVIDAFGKDWTEETGITRVAFAKERLLDDIKKRVLYYEQEEAKANASFTDLSDVTVE